MVPISYRAKAPGTLMLCGEHAVLQNRRAIVFAINKWITITLKPRSDLRVIIDSTLGNVEVELNAIQIQKPFEFVFATILSFKEQLKSGFELTIVSEFKEDRGLGSSAAVTVAMVAVLYQFIQEGGSKTISKVLVEQDKQREQSERDLSLKIFETSKAIIQAVQGVGSGADVAASVYGGIIEYQQQPPYVLKKMSYLLPLMVIYSGSKMATPKVVRKVEDLRKKYPKILNALYEAIDASVSEAVLQIEKQDWVRLGELLNIQQGIMNALGVGTPLLNQLVDTLNQEPYIYGSKISGSGLGDCVIGIGKQEEIDGSFVLSKIKMGFEISAGVETKAGTEIRMGLETKTGSDTRTGVSEILLSVSFAGVTYE